jgi:MSHA biogenesis protein MshO
MTRRPSHPRRSGGFTLVEAVVSIVIIGIVAGIVAVFIRAPVLSYRATVERAELTDQADLALRRMARDLRLALPNSIVTSSDGTAISFFVTKTGGRYLAADDDVAGLPPLDFVDPSKLTFTMIGLAPTGKQAIDPATDYVVVNNVGTEPADAYSGKNIAKVAAFATVAPGLQQFTLATNPFAQQVPPMPSPGARFHVVQTPVTYHCTRGAGGTGSISLQWDYGIVRGKPAAAAGKTSLLAGRVTDCKFNYSTDANRRGALAVLAIELEMPGQAGRARLVHQVHVDNTP